MTKSQGNGNYTPPHEMWKAGAWLLKSECRSDQTETFTHLVVDVFDA